MSYINSCVICTCDFQLNDNVTKLQCGHAYHTDCILQWLAEHSTCPFCRQNVASWDSTLTMKLLGFYDIQETTSPSDEVLKEIIRKQNREIEAMRSQVTKCREMEEKYELLRKKFKRRRKARFFNGNGSRYVSNGQKRPIMKTKSHFSDQSDFSTIPVKIRRYDNETQRLQINEQGFGSAK